MDLRCNEEAKLVNLKDEVALEVKEDENEDDQKEDKDKEKRDDVDDNNDEGNDDDEDDDKEEDESTSIPNYKLTPRVSTPIMPATMAEKLKMAWELLEEATTEDKKSSNSELKPIL